MLEKSLTNKLEKLLSQYEEAFTIDELCGFLYGISITQELIIPNEWLPVIFNGDLPGFDSKNEA
ncbi:MAG: UPF0149 family protein [Magnetococcales bacterium]|nr:UPF0149 family protein [Magnetococcales bacterium]